MAPDAIPAWFSYFQAMDLTGLALKETESRCRAHDSSADLLLPTRSRWLLHIGACRNLGQLADHSHDE